MKLTFPFKNLSVYTFLQFIDNKENIRDYILTVQNLDQNSKKLLLEKADNYKNTLPNFENEILQIINTTDQSTIDYFFSELINNCNYIKSKIEIQEISKSVKKWNEESLKQFNNNAKKESEKYTKSETNKTKHSKDFKAMATEAVFNIMALSRTKEIEPELIDERYIHDYSVYVSALSIYFFDVANRFILPYQRGEILSKYESAIHIKPVVFLEGEYDIIYIRKAAEILKQDELLDKVELRQRGGWKNLDKLWDIFKENNWETILQKKLILYDCDVDKKDAESGNVYRRTLKFMPENIISKGIENLFPTSLVEKAIQEKSSFIDIMRIEKTKRGVISKEIIYTINEDEKKNFCEWICEHAQVDDFRNFKQIFDFISILA